MTPHADAEGGNLTTASANGPDAMPATTDGDDGSQTSKYLRRKSVVILLLFGVTGVLGLPLLWMNRRFTDPERYFWAAATVLWTALLSYGCYRSVLFAWEAIRP